MNDQFTEALADVLPVLAGQSGNIRVYQVNGELCMAREDLGNVLGFSGPDHAMNKLHERHSDELQEWTFYPQTDGKRSGGRPRAFYWEEGIYIACMFAKTPIAKEVRISIARLLKRLRMQGRCDLLQKLVASYEELRVARKKQANRAMTVELEAEIYALGKERFSTGQICKNTGWARSTVRKYLAKGRRLHLVPPRDYA